MLPPFERDPDQDRLKLTELSRSLRRFIDRHGGSPVVTGEVMRAFSEIARLYHNARARARSAERREAEADRDHVTLLAVTRAARGLLDALDSYQEALGARDPERVARFAEALAAAVAMLGETLGPPDPPSETAPNDLSEAILLEAIDRFADQKADEQDEDPSR
jgi:hypothetical protein